MQDAFRSSKTKADVLRDYMQRWKSSRLKAEMVEKERRSAACSTAKAAATTYQQADQEEKAMIYKRSNV